MTDYSKLSDDEINEAVAIALWDTPLTAERGEFDPCNSWADTGPIIEENKIHLIYENDAWDCRGYTNRHIPVDVSDKKPLRAALIVFLMMKDAENEADTER